MEGNVSANEEPGGANGIATTNEGPGSHGPANETAVPQDAANEETEPYDPTDEVKGQGPANEECVPGGSANEDAAHEASANEDTGHRDPANEIVGCQDMANEAAALKDAADEETEPRHPTNEVQGQRTTNEDGVPGGSANEDTAQEASANKDAAPEALTNEGAGRCDSSVLPDPTNGASAQWAEPSNGDAALRVPSNEASDPWDWSREEAWLWAPEGEGWEEDEEVGERDLGEGLEEGVWPVEGAGSEWWLSPDGAFSKQLLRRGRGLACPGLGSWCHVWVWAEPGLEEGAWPALWAGLKKRLGPGQEAELEKGAGQCQKGAWSGQEEGPAEEVELGVGAEPRPAEGACPFREGAWLRLQLGGAEGRWAAALDSCLRTMRKGERALLRPTGAGRVLGVLLRGFSPAPPFWAEGVEARERRWAAAAESGGRRAAGLLEAGATEAAARAYGRALRAAVLAGGAPPLPPGRAGPKAELHAGLALCQLRLGLPAAAAANATKALELSPGHAEARLRRAAAAAAMGDLEAALEDLRGVLRAEPGHRRAREELRRVRGAARERDRRLARRLGRLFA